MSKIAIEEVSEETRYVWQCECEEYNEEGNEPEEGDFYICKHCSKEYEIVLTK